MGVRSKKQIFCPSGLSLGSAPQAPPLDPSGGGTVFFLRKVMFVWYEVSLTHISGVNGCSLWACALLIVSKRKGVRNEALPLVGQLTFGHFL